MDEFKTPTTLKFKSFLHEDKPLIPESPLMTRLGYGTGISVYSLKRSPKVGLSQSPWAVKKVCKFGADVKPYEERLKDEANILKKLSHPNIIGFRAFVKAEDGRDCLAMEECDCCVGDLIETRHDDGLGPFPAEKILKVASDVAKALDYLHTQCRLLHGDVKSFNILVKGDFEIMKLCDFGVSVPLTHDDVVDNTAGEVIGTTCWLAPEVVDEERKRPITSKADIFSFGLVLWEMITLHIPFNNDSFTSESSTASLSVQDTSFGTSETFGSNAGTRPPLPTIPLGEEYNPVIELFTWCTEEDYKKRPSAKEVVEFLEALKKTK